MKKYLFMLLGVVWAVSGCAGSKGDFTPVQKLKAPEWVIKGSGAFKSDGGKMFYGVGSASSIGNPTLLRTAADDRARNELAKIFETYSASLLKDYMTSTVGTDRTAMADEQNVELAIKTVTAMTLTGSEIIDHWQNPDTGELFSLARVDIENFKQSLGKMKEMNEQLREHIRRSADKLHEELGREEVKRR